MKRIGIDARLIFQTGVGTYLRNLIHYLPDFIPENYQVYLYLLKEDLNKLEIKSSKIVKRQTNSKWHSFSEQINFLKEVEKDDLNLMHFTYFSYPIFYSKPFIATVHDLTPILFKTGKASTKNKIAYKFKHYIFEYVLKSQIKNSKAIITPTKSVAKQIQSFYGEEAFMKTQFIYEGVNYELMENKKTDSNKKYENYFLYVGNFYPHKNVDRLIEAFTMLENPNIKLKLVGPDNFFSKKIKQKLSGRKLCNIKFIHNVNNKNLANFYKNAKALVNPSLSEGFGLPIVEAAYFGCPIVASDIHVFQEVTSGCYTKFDPKDVSSIAKALNSKSFIKPFYEKEMSFLKMTKKTVEFYKKLS